MDVSALVVVIEQAAVSTGLVAVTVLTVLVALKVMRWIRKAL